MPRSSHFNPGSARFSPVLTVFVLLLNVSVLFAQQKRDTVALHRRDTSKLAKKVTLQSVEIVGTAIKSYKSSYSFFGNKSQTPILDIPQSISTVTKELIHDKMEFTLKDAADNVSGVNQYSGFDEYTIRGFRAENARDINGLRGYNTTYTSPLLVNIERVEIIKGPSATLYGNCDPGGTINLVTKKPLSTNQTEFNIYQGSWNHIRGEADVTGPLNQSKTLLFRFNAGYDDGNSFRDHIHSQSYEIAPSLSFVPNGKMQLNVDFSISHMNTVLDQGQPGFEDGGNVYATPISLTVVQPGDYLHETDIASIISFSYKITKNITFNSGYLNYTARQYVASHGINSYLSNDSVNLSYTKWSYPTSTNTINNYFTWRFNTGKVSQQLLVGYDYVRSKVNLNQQYYELPDQFGQGTGIVATMSLRNPQYIARPVAQYQQSGFDNDNTDVNDDVYHTQGVYVQDQFSLNKWKLLIGLREEFYTGADSLQEKVFMPRVGLVYQLRSNVSVYGTYNKGFDPFEAASSAQVFSQPFKPLTSQLWETGIKGNFLANRLYASLAIYQLTVQNVAVNANIISNPNLFIQQGENRSHGVEAEVAGNVLPNLSVMLSYAYCVSIVTKSDIAAQIGTTIENAPRNSGSSYIKYTFAGGSLKGFGISGGYTFAGTRNTLDPETTLPGYIVLNGGLHYGYKRSNLALNVNNITNKTYWTGAYNNVNKWPGQPRNYMLNLGFRL